MNALRLLIVALCTLAAVSHSQAAPLATLTGTGPEYVTIENHPAVLILGADVPVANSTSLAGTMTIDPSPARTVVDTSALVHERAEPGSLYLFGCALYVSSWFLMRMIRRNEIFEEEPSTIEE